jgi:hypothetical protein
LRTDRRRCAVEVLLSDRSRSAAGGKFDLRGAQALVNQKTGAKQGNPNVVYYALARSEYGATGSTGSFDFGSIDAPCTNVAKSTVLLDCYRPSGAIGVLSTSNTSFKPTYPTTTGWDFATGIGSINVTNLVNHW